MKTSSVVFSIAAGLVGGALSNYFAPALVHAQTQTAAPREIRAQSFVLVNERDEVLGTLSADRPVDVRTSVHLPDGTTRNIPVPPGSTKIKFTDPSGRVVWSAGGSGLLPLRASR